MKKIRPNRTIETYSRGLELIRAIHALWEINRASPLSEPQSEWIKRIKALCSEYDLTVSEWHYWAKQAAEVK